MLSSSYTRKISKIDETYPNVRRVDLQESDAVDDELGRFFRASGGIGIHACLRSMFRKE